MKLFSFLKIRWERFAPKKIIYFWYRHYKVMLFVVFLVVLGFGGFSWYESLYGYHWNDEQKKQFLDSYVKETNFNEAKFRDAVARLKERARSAEERPEVARGIFSGKSIR
jgi:hypothetical protein